MFGKNWKTGRILLTLLTLLLGGFYAGVAFLGQNWGDQARYLLTLVGLLLVIVVCAAALVLVFKLVGSLWDLVVARKDAEFKLEPDQDAGDEPPASKQE